MIAKNANRVPSQTDSHINAEIRKNTEANLAFYAEHRKLIHRRLAELDREWDIERALETGSAGLSLLGLLFGLTRRRRWLVLPLAVQSFFLQHALQGWCPPLPLLRRLGFRTVEEIDRERYGLLSLISERAALRRPHRHSRSKH